MSDRDDYIIGVLEDLQDDIDILAPEEVYDVLEHLIHVLSVRHRCEAPVEGCI